MSREEERAEMDEGVGRAECEGVPRALGPIYLLPGAVCFPPSALLAGMFLFWDVFIPLFLLGELFRSALMDGGAFRSGSATNSDHFQ